MQTMRTKKRITMAEASAELGLSRMTVSSVINNHARKRGISEKTILRVQEYMLSSGYAPYRCARDLKQGKTGAVGILHSGSLFSHLTDAYNRMCDFFSESPQRLELMAAPQGGTTEAVIELVSRCVSYLVWIHTAGSGEEFENQALKSYLTHVAPIIYNYHFNSKKTAGGLIEDGYHLIGVDREKSWLRLAEMLKELGHAKILMPEGEIECRLQAFKQTGLKVLHLPPNICAGADFEERGRKSARAAAGYINRHGVSAVCFSDDVVAGYALSEFAAMGVSVPDDITVTGFDGLDITRAFNPSLTTLGMPVKAMVECVRKIIFEGGGEQKNIFRMEILRGKSHARAARQNSRQTRNKRSIR